jgi:adenylate cyclase class 2
VGQKGSNMQTEIEVKFLNVDFDALRHVLKEKGADLHQPMRLMRRAIIEPPLLAEKDAFVRVRDEGDKVTLTYKQFHDHSALSGVKELETTVGDFESTVEILKLAGLEAKSYQESRRETWHLGSVEIVLDEWPWLNPYIEIEGETEVAVKEVAALLGFDWNKAIFGSVTAAYQVQYPEGDSRKLITLPEVMFGDPVPAVISGKVV